MSKISPLIVLVKNIHCQADRQQYSEATLHAAAESILAGGGVLKPLVLKRRGFEEYDLIDGEFEYFAALKARELNPIQGESIDAYVMDANNQAIMMQQLQLFRQRTEAEASPPTEANASLSAEHLITLLQPLLAQLEGRLEQRFQGLEQQLHNLTPVSHAPVITQPATATPQPAASAVESQPAVSNSKPEPVPEPAIEPAPASEPVAPVVNTTAEPAPVVETAETAKPVPSTTPPQPDQPAWLQLLNTLPVHELKAEIERAKLGVRNVVKTHLVDDRPFNTAKEIQAIKFMGESSVKVLKAHFSALAKPQSPPPDLPSATAVAAKAPPLVEASETVNETAPPSPVVPTPPSAAITQASDPCLHILNTEDAKELLFKLSRAKLTGATIDVILKQRPFNSLTEVEKIKGVGKVKLKNIKKLLF